MRISKSTVGILISMVLLSIFFANVANLLSTDTVETPKGPARENFVTISDSPDRLVWLLQISDIHISIFRDPTRITEFKEFCHHTVDAIKPSVVLASGDLTDAKTSDAIGSRQFEQEWIYYRRILNECNIQEKTLWLDIRGNHDNFNVADIKSKQNFFTNYSIQGKTHPRSYRYQLQKGSELYSFIGIDACLEPGPRRPFNFIGILDDLEVNEITKLINETNHNGSNYTVWFGHFPTSCILTPSYTNVRKLIGMDQHGMVYVCGHLHKLGGLVPQMYTLQKAGFLELELGDWKDNRVYRLLVIDHGMFSFLDIEHRKWPVALVTNPKHALFMNNHRENLEHIKTSTHIRVLAFSLASIDFVKIKIDGSEWMDCIEVEAPLYVSKWHPSLYASGVHTIQIHVKDVDGRETFFSQPFCLDGTQLSFRLMSKIVLMTNASTLFRTFFIIMLLISVIPLCLLRYLHRLSSGGKIRKPRLKGGCPKLWLRKFWILSTVDKIFYPMIFYPIYLSFGPWSIGHLVEDHIGVIFAWGIFVNGAYLPGSFTYAYGFIQLMTFQVPLLFILAHVVDNRFQTILLHPDRKVSKMKKVSFHVPFFIVFSLQVSMAYLFWLAYGTLAFVLGPLRTWSLILAGVLYFLALTLPESSLRRASEVWQVKSEGNLNVSSNVTDANVNLNSSVK